MYWCVFWKQVMMSMFRGFEAERLWEILSLRLFMFGALARFSGWKSSWSYSW
jgi:hypothetical protein